MASKPINIRKSTDERRSEDNDRPMLSEDTMTALNEFLAESQATTNGAQNPFTENWGLSQVHSCFTAASTLQSKYGSLNAKFDQCRSVYLLQ